MSDRGRVINRLLAFVHALLPEDWLGRAGKTFHDTTDAISRFAEEHEVRPPDLADEGVELARAALHGKANKDLAAAVKDFAEAEHTKLETELQKRSASVAARKDEAEAQVAELQVLRSEANLHKDAAEARLAELQVLHSEADLLNKLKDLGVLLRRDEQGNITVLPSPGGYDLSILARKRLLAAENQVAGREDSDPGLENITAESGEAESEDSVIKGTVVKLTGTHVVVDIGAKSEGMVPLFEVLDQRGKPKFKPGDEIEVVRDNGQAEEGYIHLSHRKAQRLFAWEEIEKAYNEKRAIKAVVVDRIKGGLTVDIMGAHAFLPGSQVDLRPIRNLDGMKGQTLEVAIIKLNKKRGNIVVSRKELLEGEQQKKRSKTLEHLEEGAVFTGMVKNLTEYGAFVDLGGVDGLLHITDMSWGRLTHPKDLVNVGDQIQVKVLKCDKEKQRVSLGFKQLTPDPWLDAEHRYPVGARVAGRVISVTDYGAFLELELGVEGLVHVSEISKRMKHPSKVVNVGDYAECVVLNVNPAERRISLSMKQLEGPPL
jgi:predicted RNA-binding protein with RPS1 domain